MMIDERLQIFVGFITPENMILVSIFTIALIIIHMYMYRLKKLHLERYLEEKLKVFQNVFYISEDAILILSSRYKILYANTPAIELFNLKKYFMYTQLDLPYIKEKNTFVALDALIAKSIASSEKRMNVFSNTTLKFNERTKEEIPVNLYFNTSFTALNDTVPGTIIVINDMRKEKAKALLAYRHKLTALPNLAQAQSDLNALYAKLHLHEQKIALVLMDIDNFSRLRSIVGYEQSNIILVKFAKYLTYLANRLNFSVYHTAHNNFLLTITDFNSEAEVLDIVNTIRNELKSFYKIGNSKLHLTASVGISIYPDSSTTLNLLDDAYKALSYAEKKGDNRVEVHHPHNAQHGYDELQLYNEMHLALEKNEFEVYYQPIVDAKTEEIVSAEALIRWKHPKHGLIVPTIFVPIMEKTGVIVELGKYVREEVLKQQKRWELFDFKQVPVAINISMMELESEGFVESVMEDLEVHQVMAKLIKFEITEGSAMISEERTRKKLMQLQKSGIDIALDDFGTGYTSFNYLKNIPANILKIDRSLIINIVRSEEDQRIVKAMIELGHTLGMKIVVEGVEDTHMFTKIVDLGSDYIQGYYFFKALPVFEFQELLREKKSNI